VSELSSRECHASTLSRLMPLSTVLTRQSAYTLLLRPLRAVRLAAPMGVQNFADDGRIEAFAFQ